MQILSLVIVASLVPRISCGKMFRKVVVHVPMKVKHHHHTHTVFKHVHHQVPVHYDHHDVHVIHPEQQDEYDGGDYHLPHGRMLDSIIGDLSSSYGEGDYDRASQYDNIEKYLRKRSKSKQKLFSNKVIGWKGRSDFDKIASEYLASIKRQKTPDNDDYRDHDQYSTYDDEEDARRKRK